MLGNLFMYEVPAGQYEVRNWRYYFYAGNSMARPASVLFTVKPGEIAYIGDFSANALTFCLSNIDHAEQSITALEEKYPLLRDRSITNLTAQSGFEPWPSSDASDRGKGLCQF
ncbi:lipoprotein [Pseudomonas syringae pv. actinidiae ICMP 18807]|uniref:Lipoprotein n=2 Tax=Pseudomonas syringae TaxID=317 RepID=S6VA18_PSESF|nr:lipoprotein [Pseudomonas syringae pv. actinidiae ICMP 18807]